MNSIFYGDNLDILRNPEYIKPESADVIYLGPPLGWDRPSNGPVKFASDTAAQW